ncbi:hypothetical protein GE21DRAFT_1222521, partial [Neurospora crassa]
IDGRSSTRKSYLIRLLFYKFIKIASIYNLLIPIIRTTPTNIVANNINNYTIHSLL